MIDRRTKNAEIFRDTERRYTTDQALVQAIQESTKAQAFISESTSVSVPTPNKTEKAKVIVSGKRSLEAAESYAKQGKKVCVLNFASATNPGGGVANGSSAQEEAICRCTTLFPCLNTDYMWNVFYSPHRKKADPLYNIYAISIQSSMRYIIPNVRWQITKPSVRRSKHDNSKSKTR